MVCVEEIDYMPEFIEEIREETGTAARRFHKVLQRARAKAEEMSSPGIPCGTLSNLPRSLRLSCSSSAQPAIRRCTNG